MVVRGSRRVLLLSDLHANPRYTPTSSPSCHCVPPSGPAQQCTPTRPASEYGQIGCDAPLPLVEAALAAASQAVPEPDAVLVSGDLVWHHPSNRSASIDTFRRVAGLLGDAFPSACVMLGNNDVFPDYDSNISDPSFYAQQAGVAGHVCNLTDASAAQYAERGFYSRQLWPGLRLVGLNTNLYSIWADETDPGLDPADTPDPLGQFAWLQQQLDNAAAAGAALWIVGHIPPALDSFDRRPLWQLGYARRYWELLRAQPGVVTAQMFGHLHSDEYRLWDSPHAAPLLLFASVSPVYNNNPAFYSLTTTDDGKSLSSITAYYANLTEAPLGLSSPLSFAEEYSRSGPFTNRALALRTASFVDGTSDGDEAWSSFFDAYKVGRFGASVCAAESDRFQSCASCTAGCRRSFACLLLQGTNETKYERCVADGVNAELALLTGPLPPSLPPPPTPPSPTPSLPPWWSAVGENGWASLPSSAVVGIIVGSSAAFAAVVLAVMMYLLGGCRCCRRAELARRSTLQAGTMPMLIEMNGGRASAASDAQACEKSVG